MQDKIFYGIKILMYKRNGFTLIELLISLAIAGLLLALAMNVYQKYIKKVQHSSGILMVKKIVDDQVIFADEPVFTHNNGSVCKLADGFAPLQSFDFTNFSTGSATSYSRFPPPGKKSQNIRFYGFTGSTNWLPNAEGVCTWNGGSSVVSNYPLPWLLKVEDMDTSFDAGSGRAVSVALEPSYFVYFAGPSDIIKNETGSDQGFMVQAIGCLNGRYCHGSLGWNSGVDSYLQNSRWTIISRGLYVDSNGEVKTTPNLYIREEESFSTASSYGSSSY